MPKRSGPGLKVVGNQPLHEDLKWISNQTGQLRRLLITKTQTTHLRSRPPRTYSDAIESPEGNCGRNTMDYELVKTRRNEHMVRHRRIRHTTRQANPTRHVVHLVKNLESGEKKYWSRWVVRGINKRWTCLWVTRSPLYHGFRPSDSCWHLPHLKDSQVFVWDVDLAYLHGKIDHEIYVKFLDGYNKPGKVGKLIRPCMVYRSRTCLEGKIWKKT